MARLRARAPRLVGVIHLPPLPGAPRYAGDLAPILKSVRADAKALAQAGYDAVIVENFGDAPFFAGEVPAITVSAMTACALVVREESPRVALGVNVLRNDVSSALAIACVTDAAFVRVNVHTSAAVTDQGIIEGRAAETLRLRRTLLAEHVAIWADVDVKHAAPLARRSIVDEVHEVRHRALADAVLVTGTATGARVDVEKLAAVRQAADCPVYVASGAAVDDLPVLAKHAHGVIVGSALRKGGVAGGPIDAAMAKRFAAAFRKTFG